MTDEQLREIEARCQRNQGRNDGMIRRDVADLIAEVRRLQNQIAAANARLIAATIPADNNAELARLAIILREQLRGRYGIYISGALVSIRNLTQAINDFDAEYERQNPGRNDPKNPGRAEPPKP